MFDEDISPVVSAFGPGEPELAIVGSIHGNEPTGVRAMFRVLAEFQTFERAVKFIVANPPAAVAHRRYLDEDMNRVFPGDPDADARERRLAAHLLAETDGCTILSIHTTHATPEPVAFITSGHPRALEVAAQLPIDYVVNERPIVDSAFSSADGVISVEAGKPENADAIENAAAIILAFLRVTGAIDEPSTTDSNTEYYTTYDTVEKPRADSYELLVENFERVEAGTVYAKAAGEALVADESFVPVLISETGYDDIFGYRGRTVAESLEEAQDAWLGEDRVEAKSRVDADR